MLRQPQKIIKDLTDFLGGVFAFELDGKREDLPLTIGSFKVTGSREIEGESYLIGFDDEGLNLEIPTSSIVSYIRYK